MNANIKSGIGNDKLMRGIAAAEAATARTKDGMVVGISGFTPSGGMKGEGRRFDRRSGKTREARRRRKWKGKPA
jgi:hypothetical protein